MVLYGLAVLLIGVSLVLAGAGWPAWIGLIAFALHLALQIRRLDIKDGALCLRIFWSNREAGLLLFAGLHRGRGVARDVISSPLRHSGGRASGAAPE